MLLAGIFVLMMCINGGGLFAIAFSFTSKLISEKSMQISRSGQLVGANTPILAKIVLISIKLSRTGYEITPLLLQVTV
jgi:hypothetical protein